MNKAVLKLYPAVDEASTAPSVGLCLHFSVDISSPAVQLLTSVKDMSVDDSDNTIGQVRSDDTVGHRHQVGTHRYTVVRGRQYVVFTAMKIKVTKNSDSIRIRYIRYVNGPCSNGSTCK